MTLRFPKPPYQVVGSKWQWHSILEDFKDEFESYDVIVDLFGGACWLSYWLQENTSHPTIICNDFDNYIDAITNQKHIDSMNEVFFKCLDIYESCEFSEAELSEWKSYEGRFLPPIGRKRNGTWRYEIEFRDIKALIASLPTRATKSLVFSRFWCGGAPAPNSLNYPKPGQIKPFEKIEGYIDTSRVLLVQQDAIQDAEKCLVEGKRVLYIADPPFSAVQRASQYYDGDMTLDCPKGSPADMIYELYFPHGDLIVFSDMEQLAELPEPSQIWIREQNIKAFGSAKYHHPVPQRVQGAYIYQHKED